MCKCSKTVTNSYCPAGFVKLGCLLQTLPTHLDSEPPALQHASYPTQQLRKAALSGLTLSFCLPSSQELLRNCLPAVNPCTVCFLCLQSARRYTIMCLMHSVRGDTDDVWYASGVAPGSDAGRELLLLLLLVPVPRCAVPGGGAHLQEYEFTMPLCRVVHIITVSPSSMASPLTIPRYTATATAEKATTPSTC